MFSLQPLVTSGRAQVGIVRALALASLIAMVLAGAAGTKWT